MLPRRRCEFGLDEDGLTQRVAVTCACCEVSPQPVANEVLAVVFGLAGRVDTCRPVNCSPTPVGEETVRPPLNPPPSAVVTRLAVAPFFQAVPYSISGCVRELGSVKTCSAAAYCVSVENILLAVVVARRLR